MVIHRSYKIFAIFLILSILLYINNLQHEFVFDDVPNVLQRTDVHGLGNVFSFFVQPYSFQNPESGAYRPMVIFSIALNYAISSTHSWSYQLLNIFLHAFVSFFFFKIANKLLGSEKIAFAISILSPKNSISISRSPNCLFDTSTSNFSSRNKRLIDSVG